MARRPQWRSAPVWGPWVRIRVAAFAFRPRPAASPASSPRLVSSMSPESFRCRGPSIRSDRSRGRVDDAWIMWKVLSDDDSGATATLAPDQVDRPRRIGIPRSFFFDSLHPDVRSAVDAAIETLRDAGRDDRRHAVAGRGGGASVRVCHQPGGNGRGPRASRDRGSRALLAIRRRPPAAGSSRADCPRHGST